MQRDTPAARPGCVSAIVPVYNEEKTVARVVATLVRSAHIDEVICVDDGSTDGSRAILRGFEPAVRVIELGRNRGKGAALAEGIDVAGGQIVAFFDADLTNLAEAHIAALLDPVLHGRARAVRAYGTGDSTVSLLLSPWIGARFTGERAYYRVDLLPYLPRMAEARFGVEVLLNGLFTRDESAVVRLDGLVGLGKEAKHPPTVAAREYLGEALEVTQELIRSRLS